jgi:hypothetical protein
LAIWLASRCLLIPCWSQEDELQFIESVESLQRQLSSDRVSERDAAESKLLELGVDALNYLEPVPDTATTDYRERMARIRTELEKRIVNLAVEPTVVSLVGKMTLGEALEKIKQQTSNNLDLPFQDWLDKPIELQLEKVEFWTALSEIMNKAELGVDRYGSSEPNQLALKPLHPAGPASDAKIPSATAKILHAETMKVQSSLNLLDSRLEYTTIELLLRWEPRLRPISVDIPMSSLKAIDEFGDAIDTPQPEEVVYGMVQPEIPEVEFGLTLPRIDRQVELIKSLSFVVNALFPGRTETFRFKKVEKLKPGFHYQKAGATVVFEGVRKNQDVYSLRVTLRFDEDNNALESHQGWVYQNEVYLQDEQGQREEAVSLESLRQDNRQVTVQYLFLERPGDRTLVYKTPASIVKLQIPLELKDIPLP